jgi:hypothetical protein
MSDEGAEVKVAMAAPTAERTTAPASRASG